MEKRHLELARKRNAVIIDGGDLFCAMQGKYDPRSDKRDLNLNIKRVTTLINLYQLRQIFMARMRICLQSWHLVITRLQFLKGMKRILPSD
jgi:hypothetical protein